MTPKEKAIELVDKFAKLPEEGTLMWYLSFEIAKKCALIAVDEMLTWFKAHSYSTKNYDAFVFYNEVKQEIEAL